MMQKGYLTRIDGALLILSYFILLYFIRVAVRRRYFRAEAEDVVYKAKLKEYAWQTVYTMIGIIIGAVISVHMIIEISRLAGISEYSLSFLLISIITSIPELIIALSAIKEKEYGIAIGDIFGSNIADVTLSLGIGPVIVPNVFSGILPFITGLYMIFASIIITLMFARKQQLTRRHAGIMMALYFLVIPILLFF
jgi:cation:H+ antiporter